MMELRWSSPKMLMSGNTAETPLGELGEMAEGTIKRLTDKGFGFISTGGDKDIFFHMSDLEGVSYDELQEGQRVSFNEGRGPKGPRAENVKLI
jgi:CspA family cold shock protein